MPTMITASVETNDNDKLTMVPFTQPSFFSNGLMNSNSTTDNDDDDLKPPAKVTIPSCNYIIPIPSFQVDLSVNGDNSDVSHKSNEDKENEDFAAVLQQDEVTADISSKYDKIPQNTHNDDAKDIPEFIMVKYKKAPKLVQKTIDGKVLKNTNVKKVTVRKYRKKNGYHVSSHHRMLHNNGKSSKKYKSIDAKQLKLSYFL